MTMHRGGRVGSAEKGEAPVPRRERGRRGGAAKIVGVLRAERSLVLAVLSIVLVKLVADNPEIGPVGHFGFLTLATLVYIFCVVMFAALGVVHHAEQLAEKYGEPYGTLILTISSVAVEVVMLTTIIVHGENEPTLARDTVFATVMILVNGLIGFSLLIGGLRYGEQRYNVKSSKVFLTMLFALTGLALILPMALTRQQEPRLDVFLVFASLVLYAFFLHVQTRRYTHFFVFDRETSNEHAGGAREEISGLYHAAVLVATIVAIAVLVEYLSVALDDAIEILHFPQAIPALVVAVIIASPESLTAIRAALRNDMQRMFNIALGSALSTVALTIPVVLVISFLISRPIVLALSPIQTALMVISLLVASITEADGSTSALEGLVQLVLFASFILTMFV
jgi:Ca2+:H+ antiporter